MYSIIATEKLFEQIKESVLSVSDEIIFEKMGPFDYEGVTAAFEEAARVACSVLVIDIDIGPEKWLLQGVKIYKQARPNTRIVLIAPGRQPGDSTVSKLLSKNVYDIVAPELPDMKGGDEEEPAEINLLPLLKRTLQAKAANYADAARWDVETGFDGNVKDKAKIVKVIEERGGDIRTIIRDNIVGNVVIAVAGTEKGIGSTHTALSTTFFLNRIGQKTAIVELQEGSVFADIEREYKDRKQGLNESFQLNGIDFYKYGANDILDILVSGYKYVVLDFGDNFTDNPLYQEFQRAAVKILVTGSKDWQIRPLTELVQKVKGADKFTYFATSTNKDYLEILKKRLKNLTVYAAPYNPDPYSESEEFNQVISQVLHDVLPKETEHESVFKNLAKVLRRKKQ